MAWPAATAGPGVGLPILNLQTGRPLLGLLGVCPLLPLGLTGRLSVGTRAEHPRSIEAEQGRALIWSSMLSSLLRAPSAICDCRPALLFNAASVTRPTAQLCQLPAERATVALAHG